MKSDEIKKLFPLKCVITEDIISSGDIGLSLLKSNIPSELHGDIFWGLSIGTISGIKIKTETNIEHNGRLVKVPLYLDKNITPQEIIFELRY